MNQQNNECTPCEPQGCCTSEKPLKGVLVFYQDVGQLPPFKTEAFLERVKDRFREDGFIKRLKDNGYEIMFLPVRPNSTTRVEMIPMSPGCMPMVTHQLDLDFLEEMEEEECDEDQ